MLNRLCKLIFISLFLVALQSYAAPPPLPPTLPSSKPNNENKEVISDSSLSIFDKLKQFFHKPSKKTQSIQPQTQQNKSEASENSKLASQESSENKAAEPFMDIGNTPLPSAANKDLHENEVSHNNGTNLASNNIAGAQLPVTPNIPNPLVTMPPLQPGSYVVPPAPPVQIYKPTNLPPVHIIPTPLNPPPNTANTDIEQSNTIPPSTVPTVVPPNPNMPTPVVNSPTIPDNTPMPDAVPAQAVTPNTPSVSTPTVNPPATPNTNSSSTPTVVPVPTVAPPIPNMPPMPAPVINSPVAPNSTPNNLPTPQPVNTPVPAVPNIPTVPTTTDSSTEIDNSKQVFTASTDKQDWNTSLKPVDVLTANSTNQSQNSSNTTSSSTSVNQTQLQPQNVSSSTNSSRVVVKKQDNIINNKITESAIKFAKDESQMLLLPNDDIVLGKLTEQATLEQMDIYSYIKLFQKKEERLANTDRRKAVENLIKYDNDINKKKDIYVNLSYCSAVDNAFRAIDKNNLSKLRVLLDIYPILQEKKRSGDTLLTAAVYNDNYYLAKYLVIRGIKISTLNSECQYPLDIALARGNYNIACMLTKAKGYN